MVQAVKRPTKLDDETLKAKALYTLYERGKISKFVLGIKLVPISNQAISAAKTSMSLDKRIDKRIQNQLQGKALSDQEIVKLWNPVVAEIRKTEPRWRLALEAREKFRDGVVSYLKALDPIEVALEAGADSGLPGVEKQSKKILEKVKEARGYVVLVDERAQKAISDMDAVLELIKTLSQDPPNSREDIVFLEKFWEDHLLAARNSEVAVKNQVEATNTFCVSAKAEVEKNISEIVTTIVGWRNSEPTRKMIDVAESFIGGAVKASQIAAGEPMSAAAAQGVHMLIKGICSGLGKIAAFYEKTQIKKEYADVLDQIELVKPDDFINWKLDLIKEGLQWLAEPLGFIPSAGALIVSCINAATDTIIEAIRDASKAAIEEEEAKKNPNAKKTTNFDSFIESASETFTSSFKVLLEDGVETLHELSEYVSGDKSPAAIIVKACAALLGEPLKKILSNVLPAMKPIDKGKLRDTVVNFRASIVEQGDVLKSMKKVNLKFAYSADDARQATEKALKDLQVGGSADVIVGGSLEIAGAKCAVLVGDQHSVDNVRYLDLLKKLGEAYRGVVYKKESDGPFKSVYYSFSIPPGDGQLWVTNYFKFYRDITSKSIKFE